MVTTEQAFAMYNTFADSEHYDKQILELAQYAIEQEYTTTELITPLITDYVETTFGMNHRVLIEKITSDVQYDMAYAVA
jgi:hypothetical protein